MRTRLVPFAALILALVALATGAGSDRKSVV